MFLCSRRLLAIFQCIIVYEAFTVLGTTLQLRTIDDEFGDSHTGVQPVYFPTHIWYQGANCTTCQLQLPNSLAFGGTWHVPFHDATKVDYGSEIRFSFGGTALSVWCILPNPIPSSDPTSLTSAPTTIYTVLFILDGVVLAENFTHISGSSDIFQYNVSIFSIENLSNKIHSFRMVISSTDPSSSVLFDYATYLRSPDPSTTFSRFTKRDSGSAGPKLGLGEILGVVFGGLFCVVVIILAVWYHLRWRRRQRLVVSGTRTAVRTNKPPNRFTVDPFILDPSRSTILRYHDYSPGPSPYTSSSQSRSQSNPSQTSSSGGGSRSGAIMALPSQGSASSPMLSLSSSSEALRGHGAMPRSNPSSPISPISQNSNNNVGSVGQESSNSRSSRRHDRRHRHHRHGQRTHITEMRREVATLRAQHQELLARIEQPQLPAQVVDQNHNQERLPEYTR
ncbi:hypothetical protein E1B28_007784 [Marasmius oreades]|uniref:Uncharacterized protein n=1 Tax=Marasmius oreades TaxID=181124 RepID=A0A9P7UUD6_9AGAR|nr:uncharacterized protein E1B28_007784 [Marasmius oreades]KAG7094175.1 hypothetical protein E1B28_007784 [Marasmius oreades]